MAYNPTTQIISQPVSVYDVQQCCWVRLQRTVSGQTQTRYSGDVGVLCCAQVGDTIPASDGLGSWTVTARGEINKFARFKPVRFASVKQITDANRKSVGHGITLPTPARGTTLDGSLIMDACALDWEYALPNGDSNSPYRLTDFANAENLHGEGYYHGAVPPIQVVYPREGWTFQRGSTSNRALVIYVDLDPDDSAINLQAEDFTASGIDLNEWTLIAFVDSQYFTNKLFVSDDTILNGGEISGNTIVISIPNGTGSYTSDVYICMYRYNNSISRYECLPLPKQGDYNPEFYTLKVIDDAQSSGGGVPGDTTEEMFKNVKFSHELGNPNDDSAYKTAWDCTDGGTAKWSMKSVGSLYVKMELRNTSNQSKTINRADLQLDLNGLGYVSATTLYNSGKSSVSSVTVPAGGTITIYLFFDDIFTNIGSDWNSSNKNSSWSMDFRRNDATLFGCDIYAYYSQTQGWTERSS